MSQIFDIVISLIIISATAFVLTYILGLLAMVLPSTMFTILSFVIAVQLVLFVIHRRD